MSKGKKRNQMSQKRRLVGGGMACRRGKVPAIKSFKYGGKPHGIGETMGATVGATIGATIEKTIGKIMPLIKSKKRPASPRRTPPPLPTENDEKARKQNKRMAYPKHGPRVEQDMQTPESSEAPQPPIVPIAPIDPLQVQHQLSHQTKANRFPKIFNTALELQPNPSRILSFGCSTGEECFTLADIYPNTEILGVDLDKWSIGEAKRKNKFKDRVGFVENLEEAGKFDIIFCLMVLFSIHNPVSFENFSNTIERLSSHLNYRGLLVLYTGQHDIISTSSGYKYSVIRKWTRQHSSDKRSYFNGYFRKIKH